jgi:hypothetical protein
VSTTWIKAVNFYSEHFETMGSITAKLPSEYAVRCVTPIVHSAIQKWPVQLPASKAISARLETRELSL